MSLRQISFDQRIEVFGFSTDHGFVIYNIESMSIKYEAKFPDGGANLISILSDSNLVAVTGDDSPGGFSKNTSFLWDCNESRVLRVFDKDSEITKIVLLADCFLICSGQIISFYSTCNFTEYFQIDNPSPKSSFISFAQSFDCSLVSLPAHDGNGLTINDYHDPVYVLGTIPLSLNRIGITCFSRQGDLIALVLDGGKSIALYNVKTLQQIAQYKRGGLRTFDATGLSFDNLGNFFLVTTKRGGLYIFSIPTPMEYSIAIYQEKPKFQIENPKNLDIFAQFDLAGYVISCFSRSKYFKQIRFDLENKTAIVLHEKKIE